VEVRPTGDGTFIVLPLLRSVGWLSRSDLPTRRVIAGPMVETPEAQCLGYHRSEYAILPHAGSWQAVYPAAYNYVAPLLLSRADSHEGLDLREMNLPGDDPDKVTQIPWRREGPLAESLSLRRTADGLGLLVRAYNLGAGPVAARLTCWRALTQAWRANLNEERLSPLSVQARYSVELPVRQCEVFTVELRF
jgi:alpha-mannosidase